MSTDHIIEALLGLITVIIAFTSFWLATQATRARGKATAKAVDASAFARAREIYEGALDTLREELVACRSELATARNDLSATRQELTIARTEITGLRNDIAELKVRIERLRPD